MSTYKVINNSPILRNAVDAPIVLGEDSVLFKKMFIFAEQKSIASCKFPA
jgi:hypothetical protein